MVRRQLLVLMTLVIGAPVGQIAAQSPAVSLQVVEPIQISEQAIVSPADVLALGEREIIELTLAQTWPAALLDRQADHLGAQAAGRHRRNADAGRLTQTFLRGQAARQRGDAVAQSLQGHYALVMLGEQAALLEVSLQTVMALSEQIERSTELGLLPPADESLWQAESTLAELRDRQAQIQGRSSEIRQQMASGLQAPWLCSYHPADPLQASLPGGDCEQWCREALARRADYLAWQQIRCLLDEASLPEAQRLVDQLIPAWTAAVPAKTSWLRHLSFRLTARRSSELEQLQSQMSRAVQGLGNQICTEVQTATKQLETALQRVELAEDQLEQIDEQLQRVRQMVDLGQARAADESRWTLRRQQVMGERLARLGEAKQAELERQRLMGRWDQ